MSSCKSKDLRLYCKISCLSCATRCKKTIVCYAFCPLQEVNIFFLLTFLLKPFLQYFFNRFARWQCERISVANFKLMALTIEEIPRAQTVLAGLSVCHCHRCVLTWPWETVIHPIISSQARKDYVPREKLFIIFGR